MSGKSGTGNRQTEFALVREASRRLAAWSTVRLCCYVPLLGRCVDLAYILAGSVVTVEFKLHDWRRAVIQARDHRLAADYAYICMPERNVSSRMLEEIGGAGIGLLFYDKRDSWPFRTVKRAPRSTEIWAAVRSDVWDYIVSNEGS